MAKQLNVSVAVTADTSQAKAALQALQNQLTQLTMTPANFTLGGSIKQEAVEASKAISQLQAQLKSATNIQTGNLDLTKFYQSMQRSGMQLRDYQKALATMGPAGNQAFAQLANSISQAEIPLRRSNAALKEFGTTIVNTARWQMSSSIIHGIMGAIQGAYGYAQDLNKSLTDIQIVTQASDQHMARFAESANKAAKELSTTTTAYTNASLIYYQQGLNDQQVKERTDVTIKMANAAGVSAEKVSNQMTAVWNNFYDGSHSLEYYADVMTALGAATASSTDEISTGLSKFASVADTVGLSYENAAAALATITATTRQSADSVGTGLRTLFSRLQSLNLGETLDDGVTLTKYTKALETIGVSALDASGNLRSMDDILEDMGSKWDTLNAAQKTALAQTVGGVRQYTTLIALMDNFDFYKQNQQVALGSEGTVQKQADIYAKSWEAAQKRVKASAQSIYSDLIDDKFFIGLNNSFAKFLDVIHNSIQAFGGLKGVLLGIGTLITTIFANKAATGLQNFIDGIRMLTPKGRADVQALRQQGADMLIQNAGQGNDFIGQTMSNAYAQQGALQNAYLANVQRMTAEQQNVAQAMMQQQQILIKNVQLSAEQVQKTKEQATQESINAKKLINQNINNNKPVQSSMKSQLDLIAQEAKTVGKIESFLKVFDSNGAKVTSIDQVTESLKKLGLTSIDFESWAPGAGQAFKQLEAALNMPNADPKKIDEIQKALDKLNTIHGNGQGGTGLSLMTDNLKQLAQTYLPTEQYESFCNILDKVVASAQAAGGAELNLTNAEQQLKSYTDNLSASMAKLAQQQYTLGQSIVGILGGISSLAMAITNIKGLMKTWNDDSLSFGDKLLSTMTTVGFTATMMANGFKQLGPALTFVAGKVGAVVPGLNAFGAAATGMATKLGVGAESAKAFGKALAGLLPVLAAIAAIAVVVAGVIAIANAITTPKEHMENLTAAVDQSKTAAEEAKQAYDDLLGGIDSHNELLESLKEMTQGTIEFQQALIEANKQATDLIEKYHINADEIYTDPETGAIRITDEGYERVKQQQSDIVNQTYQSQLTASAALASEKVKQDFDKIVSEMPSQFSSADYIEKRLDKVDEATLSLLDKYGYASARQFFDQYSQQGRMSVLDNMYASSGAAVKNQLAVQNIASQIGADVTDPLEQLLIQSVAQNSSLWSNIEDQATRYYRDNGKYIDLENKNTRISSLEDEYQKLVDAGEILTSLEDFKASDAFMNADTKTQKQMYANAIKNARETALMRQAYEQQQQAILNSDLRNYTDYKDRNAAGMAALRETVEQKKGIEAQYGQAMLQEYNNAIDTFSENAARLGLGSQDNQSALQEQMKKLSINQMNSISRIGNNFASTFGKNTGNFIFDTLAKELSNGNLDLEKALENIDLSGSVLKSLKSIRTELNKFDFGEELYNKAKKEAGGNKGLFEDLYESEDFSKDLKKLQKSFKKTGKIGAKAILDMSDETEILQDFLDEADVTAAGLADTLMAMEMGDIGIDAVTDELLAANSAASDLQNALAECFAYIDNFDLARSSGDIGKFYAGLAKNVQEGVTEGRLYDPQVLQSFGELFGQDRLYDYMDSWAEWTNQNLTPEQLSAKWNSEFAAEIAAIDSIQKYGDLGGMFEYYSKQGPVKAYTDENGVTHAGQSMFTYNSATGQVETLDETGLAANGWDTREGFVKGLMDNYGVSEAMAKQMAMDYATRDPGLYETWQKSNTELGLAQLFGGTEGSRIGLDNDLSKFTAASGDLADDAMVTAAELKSFYDTHKDALRNTYSTEEEFMEAMQKLAQDTGHALIDMSSETINAAKKAIAENKNTDAYNQLKDSFKGETGLELSEYLDRSGRNKDTGTWENIDQAAAAYERLGFTASEAYDLIDAEFQDWLTNTDAGQQAVEQFGENSAQAFQKFIGASETQWTDFNNWLSSQGLTGQISAENWQKFLNSEQAYNEVKSQAEIFANAFKEVFSSMKIDPITGEITFEVDEGSAAQAGEEGAQTAQEATEPVELELEITDPAVKSAVDEAVKAVQQASEEQVAEITQQMADLQATHKMDLEAAAAEAQATIDSLNAQAEQAKADAQQAAQLAEQAVAEAEAKAQEAEQARAEAERVKADAESSAQQILEAEAHASELESAAAAAQQAAQAAVSNAAAQASAAQAAATAAAAAVAAAQSIVDAGKRASQITTNTGEIFNKGREQYIESGGESGVMYDTWIPGDSKQEWVAKNFAQWYDSASDREYTSPSAAWGDYLDELNAYDHSRQANRSGDTDRIADARMLGLLGNDLLGMSEVATSLGFDNFDSMINSILQLEETTQAIADNTENTTDAIEEGNDAQKDTTSPSDKVVTREGDGKSYSLTTEQKSQISQSTGYDTSTIDAVQVLKNAGITSKDFDINGLLNFDNLSADLQNAITTGMEKAGVNENTQMPDKQAFEKITGEMDKIEVNATAEVPVEAKDPEQVVTDVQAEADSNPAEIETTATVTEVESDIEMEDQEATVDYDKGSQEEPEDEEAKVNYVRGTQQPPVDMSAAVNYVKGSQEPPSDMTATVNYVKGTQEGPGGGDAGGYNNGNGSFFASGYGGNHIAGAYQGLATVGELGPELMIHGNQAFLVGINGRTTAYVHPDDTIYTAAETQKIMNQNPTLQDLPGFASGYRWPGFSVGYSRISWGSTSPGSGSNKAPRAAAKQRSKDFDPERYHYQTRVIADLNRYLERMNKLKDHAYGSHRIRAIRNEITATEDLIKANEKLLDEANKYLEGDRKAAADLGAQFDDEGNIINWDELQEKYARPAAEDSENEEAKKNWKLIQQYEETIDKIHDTVAEIDDLRWSLSDLVNEEIEAKVDVKIDMDDRELDLLDYYLDKVKDNIDKTKDAIGIVNGELGVYTDEISTYQKVMDDLLRNARNAQGDKITGLTLDKWMKMTPEQRDALDIDYDLGKKLEEYSEEILDAMKKIQDLKLYAVDALNQAFEELNNNVQESTELFDHYGSLLESLKDISDLQGTIMNKDLQKAMDSLNKSMLNNTKNSIKAQQDYYKELSENAKVLKDQIANAQDWQVKEALQEQLDNIETLMRDAEQNILGLWQDGLSKAQDMFEFAIENITKEYEKAIAGAYANVDGLKEAYERQQTVNGQYVDDYERMYQLSKLQRTINRDLDAAAVNGNRHNKNLKALLTEIEGLQASGQEMSEYDLELLQKRYEYEKALADLEDARNAKQTVRLQRDRNGNWGYVYTAADDEELAKQEQAVEDKLYEWQKFEMESIDDFSSQLFDLQTEYGEKLSNIMSATWDSDEDRDTAIANLDAWYQERLEYLNKYLNTAFDDANSTIDKAKKRYDTDQFEIIDTFGETTLGMINNTVQTTEELIANLQDAMNNMKTAAQDALTTYSDTIIEFNKLVEESNELFAEYANGQATSITRLSDDQLGIVQKNIEDMANKLRTGNDAMLVQVEDFNKKYYEKFNDPETGIITTNERFLNQLQDILSYLNRIDYAVDSNATVQKEIGTINSFSSVRDNAQQAARFDTGGYTGSWGAYGKFAVLDQKEQVFNAEDTKNLLDAAHILRTLDVQSGLFSKGLGDFFAPYVKDLGQTIEQDVHITAEFPNATNRTEIEEAFNNLVNRATQYANRKAG